MKKILIAAAALLVVCAVGLFFWARSVLTGDAVRTAVASQLSQALGQPVEVGGVSASIYPRVTMTLSQVRIGQPNTVEVGNLDVGTDFGALLSRRIEHASLRVDGAHIQLPLPPITIGGGGSSGPSPASGGAPVEIVSIDEITLSDVEIKSGGRTLRGDIELVPRGTQGFEVRRIALAAADTTVEITGEITTLSPPTGTLAMKAGVLDFDTLMAFLSDFSSGASAAATPPPEQATAAVDPTASLRPASASASSDASARQANGSVDQPEMLPAGTDIAMTIDADRATFGDLTLDKVSAKARIAPDGLLLDPITFGVFGGQYDGSLDLTLDDPPAFDLDARLTGVGMPAVMTFAGTPGLVTGTMAGTLALKGSGTAADAVLKTAHGTASVNLSDGTVKGLGLVRGIVLATSGREDSKANLNTTTADEPFTSLTGTLAIANGTATTNDLAFESKDLSLAAAGTVALDGSAIDVKGQVLLSQELTAQAGRDFQRLASEQGRIRLPVTITGSAQNPQVRIDVANAAKRAITNKANEEINRAIERNVPGGLRLPGH